MIPDCEKTEEGCPVPEVGEAGRRALETYKMIHDMGDIMQTSEIFKMNACDETDIHLVSMIHTFYKEHQKVSK